MTRFRYSTLQDARSCLWKYKLKHIDGVPVEYTRTGDTEFGTAMHLAINDVLSGGDGITVFNMYWDSMASEDLAYGRFDWKMLKANAEVLIPRFQRLHAKHWEPFKMEERIYGDVGGQAYDGTPDILGSYKGVPSVGDWKTSSMRYDKRKIVCDEQMPGYAILAKREYGYAAKQLVYTVFIKAYDPKAAQIQVLTRPLSEETLSQVEQNVKETCEDIKTRSTFPRNTANCLKGTYACEYFSKCYPEYGKEE